MTTYSAGELKKAIWEKINKIKGDERYHYKDVTPQNNSILWAMQLEWQARVSELHNVLDLLDGKHIRFEDVRSECGPPQP